MSKIRQMRNTERSSGCLNETQEGIIPAVTIKVKKKQNYPFNFYKPE